jgi:hypothetical protein
VSGQITADCGYFSLDEQPERLAIALAEFIPERDR